ncbi:hypothetical protein RFI_09238 [Reticulomyxa filosa]|uniref:Uncharacterized protein n=1 Tax=Reticulomyxa filosa TaxID=46433 RepID=X6NRF1_RETFI|nr:hypothetical protein RFI_09238 [Reticulomyxa filosa]|eukprot:ETO27897.1 hypothetical protein RFI_09238 [Reticulomyxa filosa]
MLQLLKQVANIDNELKECKEQIEQLKAMIKEKSQVSNILKIYSKSEQFKELNKNGLKVKGLLKGHFGKIYGVDWHKDNRHLLSASQDGKLLFCFNLYFFIDEYFCCYWHMQIWDTFTTKKKNYVSLQSGYVMSCAFSPSGNLTASGGLDNVCTIFDISDTYKNWEKYEQDRPKYVLIGHEQYLSCCKFFDENTIITTSGDSTAGCWDIEKEQMVDTFLGHTGDIMSVSIDRSSHLCITGSIDGTAKVWDHRTPTRCILNFCGYHESDIKWLYKNKNK